MTGQSDPEQLAPPLPRNAASWAAKVDRLQVEARPGVRGTNVAGRQLTGPVQGFGKMWQKTYLLDVGPAVSPEGLIAAWKANFAEFWPKGNRFAGGLAGINPGDVALLDLSIGGTTLSTGVLVLYADERSFTFMTPQGHMFAGWITFSADRTEAGNTQVQTQVLLRANDPLYEMALTFGGHRKENKFWEHTLTALGRHVGVAEPTVTTTVRCVDRRRQWRRWRNVWHNSAVRSVGQTLRRPFRRRRSAG